MLKIKIEFTKIEVKNRTNFNKNNTPAHILFMFL